ncbi:MAG TPA: hypothetical protein VK435_07580 [Thermodesulfovibrionales bacterium]|nr:hypothetical protein [Thermodesulfovibrionales bacterium]
MKSRNGLLLLFIIVAFAVGAANVSKGAPGEKIAIFPFENFSGDKNALAVVVPQLKVKLEQKGYAVLKEEEVNAFLLKERIRTSGYISKEVARKMGSELGVGVILTGSVNSFVGGTDPRAGVTAFLVRASDGMLVWANHAAATGDDFEKILGIGKIESLEGLSGKVLDRMLKSLGPQLADRYSKNALRIAVMPFQNKCKAGDSGMVATYMFISELFRSEKYIPLEFGDVRKLVVDLRMKDKGEINLKSSEAVAGLAGVDGIVVGCVDAYREGSGVSTPPEVEISARLINARQGKILWSGNSQVKGDDSVIMLDWGRIWSPENVAHKAVRELVKDMEKTKWR